MPGITNIRGEKQQVKIIPSIEPDGMVLIPASTFLMGSNDGSEAERPVHEVYLGDFWMDETLVTNRQFAKFVSETNYRTDAERLGAAWGYRDDKYTLLDGLSWRHYAVTSREEHPVVLVSWHDALTFARWAGKQLPTENQWEKAARGGLISDLYPWGNIPPNGTQCTFAQPSSDFPGTTVVKSFPPNNYGLYDMVGNVWQWCADSYNHYDCSSELAGKEEAVKSNDLRVRRGGAWNVIQSFRLRCSNRGTMESQSVVPNVGFRCVRTIM